MDIKDLINNIPNYDSANLLKIIEDAKNLSYDDCVDRPSINKITDDCVDTGSLSEFKLPTIDLGNIIQNELSQCQSQCFSNIKSQIDSFDTNIGDNIMKFYELNRIFYLFVIQSFIDLSLIVLNGGSGDEIKNTFAKLFQYIDGGDRYIEILNSVINTNDDQPTNSFDISNIISNIYELLPANYELNDDLSILEGNEQFDGSISNPLYHQFIDFMGDIDISKFNDIKDFYKSKINGFDLFLGKVFSLGTTISNYIINENFSISPIGKDFSEFINKFTNLYGEFINVFSLTMLDETTFECCGNNEISISQDQLLINQTEDINFNSIPDDSIPEITELDYWKKYSTIINTINLFPQYWSKGFPTPTGFVNFPTIWIPLLAIPLFGKLFVVFITINGILISPVVWELSMDGSQDVSRFTLILKNSGEIISNVTKTISDINVIDGIDIDPIQSLSVGYIKDDLPTYNRISLNNANLIKYINEWLLVSSKSLGI